MLECPICGDDTYVGNTRTKLYPDGRFRMITRYHKCRSHKYHVVKTVEILEDEYMVLTTPKPGGEWIPVEKRPPDKIGYVFGIWKAAYKPEGYEIGRIKYLGLSAKRTPMWLNHKKVTHWLPMPEELPDEWKEKE